MAFLTMEVLRRYRRTRPGARDHLSTANWCFTACRSCPGVPARAHADVPAWYPRRVVCSPNTRRSRMPCAERAFLCGLRIVYFLRTKPGTPQFAAALSRAGHKSRGTVI
jgi:hypothetical protein